MKKHKKQHFVSLATIDRNILPVVATSGFRKTLDLLYWVMCMVLYQHIVMAIKTASKYGEFLSFFCAILTAAGAIESEFSPNDNVQWLLAKPWTNDIK
jgi:hypothetical protein